jgi:hypothetical protein
MLGGAAYETHIGAAYFQRRLRTSSALPFVPTGASSAPSADSSAVRDGIDIGRGGRCAWLTLASSQFTILMFGMRRPILSPALAVGVVPRARDYMCPGS